MTLSQWFIFFLIVQLVHGLGTWKLYIKAWAYCNHQIARFLKYSRTHIVITRQGLT